MTSQRQPLTLGAMFGHYRLDRLIGRGGMGEVYEAYDMRKGRTVAVKVLIGKLAHDSGYRERFQREAGAAARLREPHVVPIHDYGEIDGRLFIDMRLVDGSSLPALVRENGPMPPEQAVAMIRQIAAALDAAHANGLIHRDVKPDNILLTPDGFAYLVDFGIAHSNADEHLTTHGEVIGSFGYMAPERFRAEQTTPAVDIYSLACVLYECLTGTKPFPCTTDAEVISAHLFRPVPRPSAVRANVGPGMDTVIERGMAKDPRDRFRTAGELAAAAQTASTTTATVAEDSSRILPELPPIGSADADRSVAPPPRKRRRRILTLLPMLLVVAIAAAAAFGVWTLGRDSIGTAVADASALRGEEIDLLKVVGPIGYKRNNCVHENPDAGPTAMIFCAANPAASDPAARFFRFRSQDALTEYYTTLQRVFQATSCPGEPAGPDSPSVVAGKEVGRKACAANRAETPQAPKPTLILTNNAALSLALYIWDTPADQAIRDYVAKSKTWQFRSPDRAADPDYFTPQDRALFDHLTNDFGPGNCSHGESGNVANAQISCGTRPDYPSASFYGFANGNVATSLYQADLGLFQGRACGGGAGSDDAWRKSSRPVGRFFCMTDADPDFGPITCLIAMHEKFAMMVQLCTAPAASPEPTPKSEAELLAWFQKFFG